MLNKITPEINVGQRIFLVIFLGVILYTFFLSVSQLTQSIYNDMPGLLLGLIVVTAGFICLNKRSVWKNQKNISRGLLLSGMGLVFWGTGNIIWSYYSIFNGVVLAYPSLADIFYLPSVFLYTSGIIFFNQDFQQKPRNKKEMTRMTVAIIFISVISFCMMATIIRGGKFYDPEATIALNVLNMAYPCIDFVGLILAIFLSGLTFKDFKSKYGSLVFLLNIGLVLMFIADSFLSYFVTNSLYYNGGFTDFLFTIAMSTIIFSLLAFCSSKKTVLTT